MTKMTRRECVDTPAGSVTFVPIGIIRSPHTVSDDTPIQPIYTSGAIGRAEIFPEFAGGLSDLEGFTHIHLIYYFHMARARRLVVKAFLDGSDHGVFATRAPSRPNPIGLSLVRLSRIEGTTLILQDLDLLDGTPLLDIKPHIPDFDCRRDVCCGWYDRVDKRTAEIRGRRQHENDI